MEQLIAILNGIKGGIDYENETGLFDDGLLDSLDLMGLISELEDRFDIEIGMDEIVPENFNSAKAMYALVQKLQG